MKVGAQKVRRGLEMVNLSAILLLVVAAPVVGDIGSCGEQPIELDAKTFFTNKALVDCARCRGCGIITSTCTKACEDPPIPTAFPEGCYPIVHDGEVCLHALEATSCSTYESYVSDQGASIPTECNFCPLPSGAP
ncbi:MAG TPA: hypothetical protein PK156_24005 [Polyangium sp.]|nr:hypothetical protein [Polyangium sp.]